MLMKAKLIENKSEAKGTKSFVFKTDNQISFLPGQFVYITLPKLDFPDSREPHATLLFHFPQLNPKIRCKSPQESGDESGYKKTFGRAPHWLRSRNGGPKRDICFG